MELFLFFLGGRKLRWAQYLMPALSPPSTSKRGAATDGPPDKSTTAIQSSSPRGKRGTRCRAVPCSAVPCRSMAWHADLTYARDRTRHAAAIMTTTSARGARCWLLAVARQLQPACLGRVCFSLAYHTFPEKRIFNAWSTK